jgi:hypothetical protein
MSKGADSILMSQPLFRSRHSLFLDLLQHTTAAKRTHKSKGSPFLRSPCARLHTDYRISTIFFAATELPARSR